MISWVTKRNPSCSFTLMMMMINSLLTNQNLAQDHHSSPQSMFANVSSQIIYFVVQTTIQFPAGVALVLLHQVSTQ
jgi:hypothetical protein